MKNLETLTTENAKNASTVICKDHPEWGTKSFTYRADNNSFHGRGCNSAMLFENEYHFWSIATYKK